MFVGAINSKVREILYHERNVVKGRPVCVGCSGNFTVETILAGYPSRIHSNDVALYSSIIGNTLAGRDTRLKIADPEYGFVEPFLKDGLDKIVAVALVFEMVKNEARRNLMQERMFRHYRVNWDQYFAASKERISKALEQIKIEGYTTEDVYELYRRPEFRDWVKIAFLPTYIGGYEKMYARLESVFEWDKPEYTMLSEERFESTVEVMRRGDYMFLSDHDRGEDDVVAIVEMGGLKNVYIHTNLPLSRAYLRDVKGLHVGKYIFLPEDYEITPESKITLVKADGPTVEYYKNLFLSRGIAHAHGTVNLLVFLDGHLMGCLAYSLARNGGSQNMIRCVYQMSDFVVKTNIPRLSKLLLMVTTTKEVQDILRKHFVNPFEEIYTTAFTNKPVSMKYRGIYTLAKRGEGFLNYSAKMGTRKLDEVIVEWLNKHTKKSKP